MSLMAIALVIVGNLAISGAFGQIPILASDDGDVLGEGYEGRLETLPLYAEHEYVYEGTTEEYAYQMGEERWYAHINVTLTWVDEAPPRRFSNEPDQLKVELFLDDGEEYVLLAANGGSGNDVTGGSATIQWSTEGVMKGYGIMLAVTAEDCGPMVPMVNIGGLRERADNGNTFDLVIQMVVADEGSPAGHMPRVG
jgi:hypothetical protein